MDFIKRLKLFGDSILKGVQLNFESKRYCVNNKIGLSEIGEKYGVEIENESKFGCTITKGAVMLEKALEKGLCCDAVLMDFGGNDCDFKWAEIAESPNREHLPNTPIDLFTETYCKIIRALKKREILPILTTLPPIDPQRYFNWFCSGGLNQGNILQWLGDITTIYRYQERYSRQIEKIAKKENCPLIDLRGAFLENRKIGGYLCQDGIHPNTEGQRIIGREISGFLSLMKPMPTPKAV